MRPRFFFCLPRRRQAWPIAIASQLAHGSGPSSPHHLHHSHPSSSAVATSSVFPSRRGEEVFAAEGTGPPLLLQALLGLASCIAKDFPEGKKAFIFAGPEGEGRCPPNVTLTLFGDVLRTSSCCCRFFALVACFRAEFGVAWRSLLLFCDHGLRIHRADLNFIFSSSRKTNNRDKHKSPLPMTSFTLRSTLFFHHPTSHPTIEQ